MKQILSNAFILFFLLDAFGNLPMFVCQLKHVDEKRRKKVILRENVIAFLALTLFLFTGEYILSAFKLEQTSLGIAGGIILFIISLKMVFAGMASEEKVNVKEEPFIVPLAIPYVAGPTTIAFLIVEVGKAPSTAVSWFTSLLIAWLLTLIVLLFSTKLHKTLGERALAAVERLMGMILTAISVQMLLDGIKAAFHLK